MGISEADGTIYEGQLNVGFRPTTQPLVLPIRFPAFALTTWDKLGHLSPALFREDSFDSVTRIRRGRIFVFRDTSQPHTWRVHDPLRPHPHTNKIEHSEKVFFYERSGLGPLSTALLKPDSHVAIIGEEPFISFWKIVSIENSVHSTPILTLKSYRSLGDLPEIDDLRVPSEIRKKLEEVLEQVANSNHRAGAIDVVDRCRAALSLALGYIAEDRGLDLVDAIKKIQKMTPPRNLICHAAFMVARLHPRGKPNEEFNYGTRPISEEDAQLAIGCLGLVIKELGWAKA